MWVATWNCHGGQHEINGPGRSNRVQIHLGIIELKCRGRARGPGCDQSRVLGPHISLPTFGNVNTGLWAQFKNHCFISFPTLPAHFGGTPQGSYSLPYVPWKIVKMAYHIYFFHNKKKKSSLTWTVLFPESNGTHLFLFLKVKNTMYILTSHLSIHFLKRKVLW